MQAAGDRSEMCPAGLTLPRASETANAAQFSLRFISGKARICIALLALLIGSGTAFAHGVGYRPSGKSAVALEFYYSTGETMAYEEAQVFSPQDANSAYQSGRTDEFGRYSFIPETEGEWRVVVKDHEGHRAEAAIQITSDFLSGGETVSAPPPSLPQGAGLALRAALGVSLLFNIAAMIRLKCT
jgi:nickel transport protein